MYLPFENILKFAFRLTAHDVDSCNRGIWNPAANSPRLRGFQAAMEPLKQNSFYFAKRRIPRDLSIKISAS